MQSQEIKLNLNEHEAHKLKLAICGSLNGIEDHHGPFGERSDKYSQEYSLLRDLVERIIEAEKKLPLEHSYVKRACWGDYEDVEIDYDAEISQGDTGAWVRAWVWVADRDQERGSA